MQIHGHYKRQAQHPPTKHFLHRPRSRSEMKAISFALLLLVVVCAQATKDSGESHESHERRRTCGGLVEEPAGPTSSPASTAAPTQPSTVPTPAPGECYCTPTPDSDGDEDGDSDFHSNCIFVVACRNMSVLLTIEQQLVW